jgi:hypothetical protein
MNVHSMVYNEGLGDDIAGAVGALFGLIKKFFPQGLIEYPDDKEYDKLKYDIRNQSGFNNRMSSSFNKEALKKLRNKTSLSKKEAERLLDFEIAVLYRRNLKKWYEDIYSFYTHVESELKNHKRLHNDYTLFDEIFSKHAFKQLDDNSLDKLWVSEDKLRTMTNNPNLDNISLNYEYITNPDKDGVNFIYNRAIISHGGRAIIGDFGANGLYHSLTMTFGCITDTYMKGTGNAKTTESIDILNFIFAIKPLVDGFTHSYEIYKRKTHESEISRLLDAVKSDYETAKREKCVTHDQCDASSNHVARAAYDAYIDGTQAYISHIRSPGNVLLRKLTFANSKEETNRTRKRVEKIIDAGDIEGIQAFLTALLEKIQKEDECLTYLAQVLENSKISERVVNMPRLVSADDVKRLKLEILHKVRKTDERESHDVGSYEKTK